MTQAKLKYTSVDTDQNKQNNLHNYINQARGLSNRYFKENLGNIQARLRIKGLIIALPFKISNLIITACR